MSIKLGNISITNLAENKVENAHTLLDFKWADHILNDVSWLRADTFSWHSGLVYIGAYQHLVDDIASITPETETIGSYTITFYRALDGHKIVLQDQIDTLQSIYETEGVAWYYILDTTNTQFKLPRTKWGFTGLRDNAGNYISESLPNIKGEAYSTQTNTSDAYFTVHTGPFTSSFTPHTTHWYSLPNSSNNDTNFGLGFDASRASSTYQNNAPVQERATQMYLYFYVGEFTQTAIQQTAGITTAQLNNKIDIDHLNDTKPYLKECYVNGTSGYNIWSNGYCEQWGRVNANVNTITFLKVFKDTNYQVYYAVSDGSPTDNALTNASWNNATTTSVMIYQGYNGTAQTSPVNWKTSGYLAEGEY